MGEDNTKNIKPDIQENTGRLADGTFPPGVSGNPLGRPKRKTLTELIHAKLDDTPDGWNKLVALVLTEIFTNKNKDVMKELWHYTDGMPKEKHEHSGQIALPILGGHTNVHSDDSNKALDETPQEN